MLIDALADQGIEDATLLDIGGGIGTIAQELPSDGVERATAVDASEASLRIAWTEAQRRGHAERIDFRGGDFVELEDELPQHDVVTLDRSICGFGDMSALVSASAEHADRLVGVAIARGTWWNRLGISVVNVGVHLFGNPFRAYVLDANDIELRLEMRGLERVRARRTWIWQVAVYVRP